MNENPLQVPELLARLASAPDRPAPHAPGTHPLWTDPHVSTSMLRAHLDPDDDAASRRPATIDATVRWLSTLLPAGARVLDLGCGPGLYAERLAAAGYQVTGVDYSAGSIGYARSRGSAVRYLVGDYREIDLTGEFDAVLLIYLDLGTFSGADRHRIFERVRGWLAPGGVFVFDVPMAAYRAGREDRRDWGVAADGFWAAEPHAWLSRTVRYDDPAGEPGGPLYLDEYVVVTRDGMRGYRVWEQCFTPESISAELAAAGLSRDSVHEDLTGAPFDPESSTTIGVVARPAG